MIKMEDIEICLCNKVMRTVIVESIDENGLKTFEEVQDETTAGTVCGGCIPDIEEILSKIKTDPDYFLSFKISRKDRLNVK